MAAQHAPPAGREGTAAVAAQQRPKLRQTSSVADLKSSFTRLRGRFGSKDKQDIWGTAEEQGVDDEDDEFVQHADAIDSLPAYAAPARPEQVPLDQSCWTKEQIRDVERKKEEKAAEEALAAYFESLSTSTKAPLAVQPETPRSSLQSLCTASSSSSRPRTNDSLPSYHSSPGSPSTGPHTSAITGRRPSLTPTSYSSQSSIDVKDSPRTYGYI